MTETLPKAIVATNRVNKLVIRKRVLVIDYIVYDGEPVHPDDQFILKTTDGSWSYVLKRQDAGKKDPDCLELRFPNVPQDKTFNLFYTPDDQDSSPFVLFGNYSYERLKQFEEYPEEDAESDEQ